MSGPTKGLLTLVVMPDGAVDVCRGTGSIAEFIWGDQYTDPTITYDEAVANAKLFLAARSLLAACKGLAALDRTPDRFASPELLAARAAIKEAEPPAAIERATGGGA